MVEWCEKIRESSPSAFGITLPSPTIAEKSAYLLLSQQQTELVVKPIVVNWIGIAKSITPNIQPKLAESELQWLQKLRIDKHFSIDEKS